MNAGAIENVDNAIQQIQLKTIDTILIIKQVRPVIFFSKSC